MRSVFLLLILSGILHFAFADDIEDQIRSGLEAYQKGNLNQAVEELQFATQMIRQQKSGDVLAHLPSEISGWTLLGTESSAVPSAVLGGGAGAACSFSRDADQAMLKYSAVTDSPMLSMFSSMMGSSMMMGMSGNKMVRVAGEKGMLEVDTESEEPELTLTIILDNRMMVQVIGSGLTEDELKEYSALIDFAELHKMNQQ